MEVEEMADEDLRPFRLDLEAMWERVRAEADDKLYLDVNITDCSKNAFVVADVLTESRDSELSEFLEDSVQESEYLPFVPSQSHIRKTSAEPSTSGNSRRPSTSKASVPMCSLDQVSPSEPEVNATSLQVKWSTKLKDKDANIVYSLVVEKATGQRKFLRQSRNAKVPDGYELASVRLLGDPNIPIETKSVSRTSAPPARRKSTSSAQPSEQTNHQNPKLSKPTPTPTPPTITTATTTNTDTSVSAVQKSEPVPPPPPAPPSSSSSSSPKKQIPLHQLMTAEKLKKHKEFTKTDTSTDQKSDSRIQYQQGKGDPSKVFALLKKSPQPENQYDTMDVDVEPVEDTRNPNVPSKATTTPSSSAGKSKPSSHIIPKRKLPSPIVLECTKCGALFPRHNDHKFRYHMILKHDTECSEDALVKFTTPVTDSRRCLKCGIVLVSGFDRHQQMCLPHAPSPEATFEKCKFNLRVFKHKCGICNEVFEMRCGLKNHLRSTHISISSKMILEPDFRCAQCLRVMDSSEELSKHCVTCTDQQIDKETQMDLATRLRYCDFCDAIHDNIMESSKCYFRNSVFRCVLCLVLLKKKESIVEHLKEYHSADTTDQFTGMPNSVAFHCPVCKYGPDRYAKIFPHITSEHFDTILPKIRAKPSKEASAARPSSAPAARPKFKPQTSRVNPVPASRPGTASGVPTRPTLTAAPQQEVRMKMSPMTLPPPPLRPLIPSPSGIVINTTRITPSVISTPTISQPRTIMVTKSSATSISVNSTASTAFRTPPTLMPGPNIIQRRMHHPNQAQLMQHIPDLFLPPASGSANSRLPSVSTVRISQVTTTTTPGFTAPVTVIPSMARLTRPPIPASSIRSIDPVSVKPSAPVTITKQSATLPKSTIQSSSTSVTVVESSSKTKIAGKGIATSTSPKVVSSSTTSQSSPISPVTRIVRTISVDGNRQITIQPSVEKPGSTAASTLIKSSQTPSTTVKGAPTEGLHTSEAEGARALPVVRRSRRLPQD